MTYKISKDRKTLMLFVDIAERAGLKSLETTAIQCDETLQEWCEEMLCNSDLQWISPHETGDLTDAPLLGIYGDEMTIEEVEQAAKTQPGIYGSILCGHWNGKDRHQPILERWAFMDYQVRSVLEDLRDKGECVFTS